MALRKHEEIKTLKERGASPAAPEASHKLALPVRLLALLARQEEEPRWLGGISLVGKIAGQQPDTPRTSASN